MSVPSPQKPTIAQLMQAIGLPGHTSAERAQSANRLSRTLAAQRFATCYLESFDYLEAYRKAFRESPRMDRLGLRMQRKRALRWLADYRVRPLIAGPMQEAVDQAELDVTQLAKRISEHIDSDIFDYAVWADDGRLAGFKFDVASLTAAQRRNIRTVEMGFHYDAESKSVRQYVKKFGIVSSQTGIEQAMQLVALIRKVKDGDVKGTTTDALAKRLESVAVARANVIKTLPASRTGSIIEGSST